MLLEIFSNFFLIKGYRLKTLLKLT